LIYVKSPRTGRQAGRRLARSSQDDLFALDENGEVYQYNFNTKTWVKLVASRSHTESHAHAQ
jgi:hypothetical protein